MTALKKQQAERMARARNGGESSSRGGKSIGRGGKSARKGKKTLPLASVQKKKKKVHFKQGSKLSIDIFCLYYLLLFHYIYQYLLRD